MSYIYRTEPYKFRAAWNNAHVDQPGEQETYFELILKDTSSRYDLDEVSKKLEAVCDSAYVSDVSWALEPCIVVPRKAETDIPKIVDLMDSMGYTCRFPQ